MNPPVPTPDPAQPGPTGADAGAGPASTADLEARLKALRLAGRLDEARALIAPLARRQGAEGEWARRLLAAHDPLWWAQPTGRRCRLRRRAPQDLPLVRRLWATPGFLDHFNPAAPPLPARDEDLARILAFEHAALPLQSRSLHWVIETTAGTAFGVASLADIHWGHRRAEFLIGVLEPPYAGAATEATLLAIDHAFGPLRLNKLVGLVPADNVASLEASAHIGFRSEGVLREQLLHPGSGQSIDLVHMALLAGDTAARARQQRVRRRLLGAPMEAAR